MGKTKNGIYYDLAETEYSWTLDISPYGNMQLFFSSKLNRDKFAMRLQDKIDQARALIRKKYQVDDLSVYSCFLGAIADYTATEKRGFRILWGGVEYWRVDSITFPGQPPRTTG